MQMTKSRAWFAGLAAVLSILTPNTAAAQLMSTCAPESPERRGEIGCTVFQTKPLPDGVTEPAFWHIDRFDSADRARGAVGPMSVAFDAAGVWWLMTIERDTTDHHGGEHVTHVGPLPLPRAARYAMTVQSAMFMPGMYSLPHHHPGVEAIYVLEGEACYETPTRAAKLHKGETLVLPADTPMRAVVTGSARRHVLAVIVHDAARPATMRMEEGTGPRLIACK
jgi:quercetin dioxygenase-like cupin family protein